MKVAIVGGSMAGLALGSFLMKHNIECEIYEARAENEVGGVGFGIAPNGMRVLRELGIDDQVRSAGSTYIGFQFLRSDGTLLARYADQSSVFDKGVSVDRGALLSALRSAYQGPIHYGTRVESADADLVIGADGINSALRARVAPNVHPTFTGLVGLGGIVEGDEAPDGFMNLIFGKRGFFGLTRIGSGRFMWWSAIDSREPMDVRQRSTKELRALLLEQHRGWASPVEAVLHRAPEIFGDNLYDVSDLPCWHAGNICLIGDAAHAVSPHSGQGVSQALEDGWMLAREIARDPSPRAFARFENARRERVARVIKYGRHSGNSKKELGPVGLWLRDRFISLLMPTLARSTAKWMYQSPLDEHESGHGK
jgi:2-polyprenyl-6-methoxyphenol hydroxylase-like FAD-dependent oxidoreductase